VPVALAKIETGCRPSARFQPGRSFQARRPHMAGGRCIAAVHPNHQAAQRAIWTGISGSPGSWATFIELASSRPAVIRPAERAVVRYESLCRRPRNSDPGDGGGSCHQPNARPRPPLPAPTDRGIGTPFQEHRKECGQGAKPPCSKQPTPDSRSRHGTAPARG